MTRSVFRRLAGESAVYGLGGVANQAVAVLLVPIYARELGAANYGIVAVLTTTLALSNLVVGLAMPQGFLRSYLREGRDDQQRAEILDATVGLRIVTSVAGLAAYSLLAVPLTVLLFGGLDLLPILLLIGPVVFFDSLNLIPLSFLRAQRRPKAYAALAFSRVLVGSSLIVTFVVVLGLGVGGVVLGSAISAAVSATGGYLLLVRQARARPRWDRAFTRHLLGFSLPLVPGAVAGWVLNLSDRYILQAIEGQVAVGVYAAGYTVGLVLNALAVQPFSLAWGAAYWEMARQADIRHTVRRVLTAFVVLASGGALLVGALGTDIVRLFLTPEFEPARFVVPFSAFAYVLYGGWMVVATGLNLESQTRWVPVTVGVASAVSVLANLLLIPLFGFMGAAYVTLVSYALLIVLGGVFSHRYYPVAWEYAKVLTALALGLALTQAAIHGPDHVGWRLLAAAAYPPLLVLLRVVTVGEVLTVARAAWRRIGLAG